MEGEFFLSQAGNEVLIKAVIQAIPTYAMSIFQLPKTLCQKINSMMSRFWWGHKDNYSQIAWRGWKSLGLAKGKGGMGFWDIECFNQAMLAKQGWRILKNPTSLTALVLKAKYYPHGSFIESTLGSWPSYAWRSLWKAKKLLKEGTIWRIGNGQDVKIWGDRWIPPNYFHYAIS